MRGAYAIQGFGEYQGSGVPTMTATSELGGEMALCSRPKPWFETFQHTKGVRCKLKVPE
jgi:hypothetical protein